MLGVPRLALLPYSIAADADASHVVGAAATLFDEPLRGVADDT